MASYNLTYIYHDCFMLETQEAVMIFDYWKDPFADATNKDYPPLLESIDVSKRVYVFVSHHHKDHFSRRIFLWEQRLPHIEYIISRDTFKAVSYMLKESKGQYQGFKPSPCKIHILNPGETYSDGVVEVKAFASTDIGNSYAVRIKDLKVFHAGDLNAWLWLDESSAEEVEEARKSYTEIIDQIREDFPGFDLVMFPVDSRLGRDYWWGAKYFVDNILTKLFVPMHFELVLAEEDKVSRRVDAANFKLYARSDYGAYLQLASTRSSYFCAAD